MIDVKIIKKPKNKAATPTLRTPGAAYGDHSVKEAVHASKADMAKMAEKASLAEQAEHAKKADEATRADEANHAKTADEATTADEAYKAYKLLDNYPEFKGVTAEEYLQTQKIKSQNIQNSDTITTKNINVTGKATFFELMIQITKAAGGMTIYSPGAFHIDEVVDTGNYYACYQRAEQDGVKLMQMCEVGDQLMCARFNVDGNGNKFYWMRVAYASPNIVQRVVDGKLVDYLEVRLDKSVKAKNCQGVPEVGDALAVFGSRRNKERQSVIVISAYNSFDIDLHAPYIAQYENVNDFNLESKKTTWLSKGGNHLTGSFTVVSGGKNMSLDDFVTKISQATFKVEADKITARIEGVEKTLSDTTKKYSELQITLNSISSTVARKSDLEDIRTEIKQTADSISLKVENGARPNLLWGSDLNLDGVDTTSKEAIEKHLGVGISDDIEVGNREMFQYLKGDGVGGSDAICFKNAYKREDWAKWTNISWRDVPLKPHTKYTISVWVKFKSYGKKGRMYVDCNSDDGRWNFGGYLHSEHHYSREDIDKWTRVRYVFDSGESRKIKDLFLACIADEEEGAQCEMWLCRPKLEEGDTATPWCEYDGTVEALLGTGIDIKNRKMIATTDNFMVQNNKGEWTFLLDENGHINAKLISAESISAQKIAQPFVEQEKFEYLMAGPSQSWYITNAKDINGGYVLASELNGSVLNIYNHTAETIKFYSTFAIDKAKCPNPMVNVRVEIEPGGMLRAIGVPIKGVEMNTSAGATTLVALVPLVPMELTKLEGNMRAKYIGAVKGFLTIK